MKEEAFTVRVPPGLFRRSVSEVWTRADAWRSAGVPWMAMANRRKHVRRWTD